MPELPEIETMRRGLLPIIGSQILCIEYPEIPYKPIAIEPDRDSFATRCARQKIVDVRRIAKRVLVELECGDSIVIQPKMAGIAMLDSPPSSQHVRVIFHLVGGPVSKFLYWDRRGLGNVVLWSREEVESNLGEGKLGPDASIVDEDLFRIRFERLNREIKVAMLDQSVVCGIGNLYAAEILHFARVHPRKRCNEIKRSQWKKIHSETIRILNEAILREGSTLKDGTYRNAVNGEGSYQQQHRVYDRANQKCLSCNRAEIERIVQCQRSTFFCPRCQRIQ